MTQAQKEKVESALVDFIVEVAKEKPVCTVATLPDAVLALIELSKTTTTEI